MSREPTTSVWGKARRLSRKKNPKKTRTSRQGQIEVLPASKDIYPISDITRVFGFSDRLVKYFCVERDILRKMWMRVGQSVTFKLRPVIIGDEHLRLVIAHFRAREGRWLMGLEKRVRNRTVKDMRKVPEPLMYQKEKQDA